MSNPTASEPTDVSEKALVRHYTAAAAVLQDVHYELLSDVWRALTERGWLQPMAQWAERLVERGVGSADKVARAIDDLIAHRLLDVDSSRTHVTGLLGAISVAATQHRVHLASNVAIHTFGGLDLLSVAAMLRRPVDIRTICPVSDRAIHLHISNDQVESVSPSGIAAFQAFWDGRQPLADVSASSHLFADDRALALWEQNNTDIKGLAIPADLLLWVGMQAAQQLGNLRFRLLAHKD